MAAPKNNQFWKQRSKHGRDTLFASAEKLWEAACEYFQWCDDNPLMAVEYNGKDAKKCLVPKMRAYTLTGLCLYLDCGAAYFRQFQDSELGKTKDFSTIVARIEATCYTQKFEGAASGHLNSSIIARDLGLAENQNNKHSGSISIDELKSLVGDIES